MANETDMLRILDSDPRSALDHRRTIPIRKHAMLDLSRKVDVPSAQIDAGFPY